MRGIFFDAEVAETVAARLRVDGWDASAVPEKLAGEDDDEGHQWAVLTDAPQLLLEVLVDTFDGWLDLEEPATGLSLLPPLDLPAAPKRIKRD